MPFESLHIQLKESKSYPRYFQLRDQLEEFIQANKVPAGTQLPDILSLSRLVGLSNRSVERAYTLLIRDGICYRRPKKGTFVNGKGEKGCFAISKVCAIVNPEQVQLEQNEILGPIYQGVQEKAREENVDIVILPPQRIPAYQKNLGDSLLGIIAMGDYDAESARQLAEKFSALHVIFLNYRPPEFEKLPDNVRGIFNDDFAGGFSAGDWIFRKGCRHPHLLSISLTADNYFQRIQGFLRAAQLHEIPVPASNIHNAKTTRFAHEEQMHLGASLVTELLDNGTPCDAIFCTNDLLAAGAYEAIKDRGLTDSIFIIGYDNILPFLSAQGNFSTLEVDLQEIGRRAISTMLQKTALPKAINIPPHLLLRQKAKTEDARLP